MGSGVVSKGKKGQAATPGRGDEQNSSVLRFPLCTCVCGCVFGDDRLTMKSVCSHAALAWK